MSRQLRLLSQKIGGDYIQFSITSSIIHGNSFAVGFAQVEFITWRLNDDTGQYWLKLHTDSNKEVRVKVSLPELNTILSEWSKFKFGGITEDNPPYYNGDKNVVEYK